jgi:hypothetical protein
MNDGLPHRPVRFADRAIGIRQAAIAIRAYGFDKAQHFMCVIGGFVKKLRR